jgi:SAM-dependent methyltransferase
MSEPAGNWLTYWNELPHGGLLFTPESEEYVRNLKTAFPPQKSWRVLDFGCGYGSISAGLCLSVGAMHYWDASENMRSLAAEALHRYPNTRPIDLAEPLRLPEDLRFDLIVVNSVIQYMKPHEFSGWLRTWKSLLAPEGRLVISDVTPPHRGILGDLLALFRFSLRHRYLMAALRTVFAERARYQQTANAHPLLKLTREQLTNEAQQAGLAVSFLPRNLTHFPGRITAVFTDKTPAEMASTSPSPAEGVGR